MIYFITTNTKDRLLFFNNPCLCDFFIEVLCLCKKMKKFELYSFCILPDHIHLMIKPGHKHNLEENYKYTSLNYEELIDEYI